MILAVLETRCGLSFAGRDVYLSVAGGLRITEPAADLAVAAALISALTDEPLPKDSVVFGEVALSGEIRPAGRADLRLKEAAKLGFKNALAPPRPQTRGGGGGDNGGVSIRPIAHIGDLAAAIGAAAEGRRR
jgi:DNA repair protein RadA/Sms